MISCLYDAVFQNEATCYQLSSVPSDSGILEHHQLRMQTIQVNLFPPYTLMPIILKFTMFGYHGRIIKILRNQHTHPVLCRNYLDYFGVSHLPHFISLSLHFHSKWII